MRRAATASLACTLAALALACGGLTPPAKPGGKAPAVNPLTPDERAAWERLRRNRGEGYVLAAHFRGERGGWMVEVLDAHGDRWERWAPAVPLYRHVVEGKTDALKGLGVATDAAKRHAGQGGVSAVAVLDLYGKPDPVAARWVVDDGKGAKLTDEAPTAELRDSLAAYLAEYQRKAPLKD
jgi:hypothetical protein